MTLDQQAPFFLLLLCVSLSVCDCPRPTLFQCGYAEMTSYLCDTVLNDLPRGISVDTATGDDLLIVGMHGAFPPCPRNFKGKVVYINGESYGSNPPGTFMLGPAPDGEFSVRVYHGAMMAHRDPNLFLADRSVLFSAPRDKFLLYLSSRCFSHREVAFDALSHLGDVYAGGACFGVRFSANKHRVASSRFQHGGNRHAFREYRFALVMENTKMDGYLTEKSSRRLRVAQFQFITVQRKSLTYLTAMLLYTMT